MEFGTASRSAPALDVANTAGIVSPVASPIMLISAVRPGWPSFMITTADAPAACALRALTAKPQVPRCMSAMAPAGKPAKSAASQPLVFEFAAGGGGYTTPTG